MEKMNGKHREFLHLPLSLIAPVINSLRVRPILLQLISQWLIRCYEKKSGAYVIRWVPSFV